MPRTGQNIYKRKDGRWEGRFAIGRSNGRTRYSSVYAKSYSEVRIKLDNAKREFSKDKSKSNDNITFYEISQKWLLSISGTHKITTLIKYENLLKSYINPEYGDLSYSEITDNQLAEFINNLLLIGGKHMQGLAPSTVSEIFTIINCIRTFAVRNGYVPAHSGKCISVKQSEKKIRILSYNEEKNLVNYLNDNMSLKALGIILCLYTGIRVGELCALKWNDINIEEKTLRIMGTMQRIRSMNSDGSRTKIVILPPKTGSSCRVIPLPDIIINRLKENYHAGTFFLTANEKYIEPRTMQYFFKKVIAECGIEDANFHSTRHTFATRCVELGFDAKSLSEILGHANVYITLNRYVHPTMEHKAMNMNKLSALF